MELLTRTIRDLFEEYIMEFDSYTEMAEHYGVKPNDMLQVLVAGSTSK